MTWWFASRGNLGGAIVEGASLAEAVSSLGALLKKEPAFEAGRLFELPGVPPEKFRNRLLTRQEVSGRELATWGKQASRRFFRPGADVLKRKRRRRRRARAAG